MSNFEIFKSSLPVMFGYGALGFAVGLYASSSGIAPVWVALASLIVYAGSGQFLLVALIVGNATLIEVFVASFLLNFRHIFYTLSLLPEIRLIKAPWRYYFMFALTDETFALLRSKGQVAGDKTRIFALTAFLNQFYWFIATVAGAITASELRFSYAGVEFSLVALFAVLGFEIFRQNPNAKILAFAFICAFVGLFVFPAKYYLFGTIMSALILLLAFKKERKWSF